MRLFLNIMIETNNPRILGQVCIGTKKFNDN